jgi:hypothetical protein
MKADPRLFPGGVSPGDLIEQPFRSGLIWQVQKDGELVQRTIPRRYRPANTHRYPPKKRRVVA